MVDFGNSIGVKLFRQVFGGYIVIALLLTAFHIYTEYDFAKDLIRKDLINKEESFKKALSNSVWHFDEAQIRANAQAIINSESIIGISIISPRNEVFIQKGTISSREKNFREYIFSVDDVLAYQDPLISHRFNLNNSEFSLGENLGEVTLYSSNGIVLDVVKGSIFIILINSIIKTVALWVLFLYFANKLLTKPLEKITKTVKEFHIDNPTVVDIDIDNNIQNELLTLSDTFNKMSARIVESFHEEEVAKEKIQQQNEIIKEVNGKLKDLNSHLNEMVKEEVDKNIAKDKMILTQSKQAAMGEMISIIAHQWRQPLTTIGITLDNVVLDIELGEFEEEKIVDQIDKTNMQLKYLSRTIDDFRNFFKEDLEKEKVVISKIIDIGMELTTVHLKSKGIVVVNEYKDTSEVEVYKNELVQVFLNIINNAKDVLVEKKVLNPQIVIRTFENEEHIVIEFEDNGGGIEYDVMEKIFEPYFSTKDAKNGTGLGLYMSKNIVEERNNGKLSVTNGRDGAIFTIALNK